jgi:ssDNA-binding replication factor A large subunit
MASKSKKSKPVNLVNVKRATKTGSRNLPNGHVKKQTTLARVQNARP